MRHTAIFPLTVWTTQGVSSCAPVIALAVRHRGDDLDGALDHVLHLGQGGLNHRSEFGIGLGGLHPIIPHPFEAFGHHMLNHPASRPSNPVLPVTVVDEDGTGL